jgi:hypothetical protein
MKSVAICEAIGGICGKKQVFMRYEFYYRAPRRKEMKVAEVLDTSSGSAQASRLVQENTPDNAGPSRASGTFLFPS